MSAKTVPRETIFARFSPNGQRVEGDPRIEIEEHMVASRHGITWFKVRGVHDFSLFPVPLIESDSDKIPQIVTAVKRGIGTCWRWVHEPASETPNLDERTPNAKVPFLVLGVGEEP